MHKRTDTDTEAGGCLGRVQSLVRAFGILDELGGRDEGMNLTQIANLVKLPRSTVHRLLTTMWGLGYVQFDKATNCWAVGVQAFRVGNAFSQARDMGRLGRPIMRSLMLEARETINISVPSEQGVFFIGQVEARGVRPVLVRPGARLPMHTSASGKAMIAYWTCEELDEFLRTSPLTRRTSQSITEPNRLVEELRLVQERGYAIDDEENELGMRCIAAPVFDEHGHPQASLSISGHASSLRNVRIHELGRTLAAAARRMTTDIGGRIGL